MRNAFLSVAGGLLLAVLIAPLAAGQFIDGYGIRAGGNSSTIVTNYADFQQCAGFQMAMYAEVLRTPAFSVQLELEYARRGYALEVEERNELNESLGRVRAETKLDYLSLPVLVRIRHPGVQRLVPYVFAGPRADYLVDRSPGQFEFSRDSIPETLSEHFARLTVSGSIGAGAAFGVGFGRELRLEGRFAQGLRDLIREEDTGRVQNRSFELGVVLGW